MKVVLVLTLFTVFCGVLSNNVVKFGKKGKVGVLLLNLGGPDDKEESVRGFLYNLFSDPDIIRLPKCLSSLQQPLAKMISRFRARKSSLGYKYMAALEELEYTEDLNITELFASLESMSSLKINSPINPITRQQVQLLESSLQRSLNNELSGKLVANNGDYDITDIRCYYSMRYWHPFVNETFAQMKSDGIDSLVLLPLYPQYSVSTTRSSLKSVQDMFLQQSGYWGNVLDVWHTVIPYWYHSREYINLLFELMQADLEKLLAVIDKDAFADKRQDIHVIFSAHGVPESYVSVLQDPYQQQIEHTALLVLEQFCLHSSTSRFVCNKASAAGTGVAELYSNHKNVYAFSSSDTSKPASVIFHLAYQSKVGPVAWLKPYTNNVIQTIGTNGGQNMLIIPISFVSDHVETLFEIDFEYRELAHKYGVRHFACGSVANTNPKFINTLSELVINALFQQPLDRKLLEHLALINPQGSGQYTQVAQSFTHMKVYEAAYTVLAQDSIYKLPARFSILGVPLRAVLSNGVVSVAHAAALYGLSSIIAGLLSINVKTVLVAALGLVISIFIQ